MQVGTLRPYRERQVQLIPWLVDDSDQTQLVAQGARPEVNEQTVFVGALHGEMTAKDLAIVMQKCFGVVLSVGLDTDKFKQVYIIHKCLLFLTLFQSNFLIID